jgi:hypothetical protein
MWCANSFTTCITQGGAGTPTIEFNLCLLLQKAADQAMGMKHLFQGKTRTLVHGFGVMREGMPLS